MQEQINNQSRIDAENNRISTRIIEQEMYLRLLESVKKGDTAAREELFRKLNTFVKQQVYRIVNEGQLHYGDGIEDVVQVSMIKILNGLSKYEERNGAHFKDWVRRVVKNCCIDCIRRGNVSKENVENSSVSADGAPFPSIIDNAPDPKPVDQLKELIQGERNEMFLFMKE